MKLSLSHLPLLSLVFAAVALGAEQQPAKDAPTDWIEPATGHRVIRLSKEPGTSSFYFHQQSYTDAGDKLVVATKKGYATIDLTNLGTAPPKNESISSKGGGNPIVGKKSRQIYYITGGSLFATHVDTKVTREIAKLPKGYTNASGLALNADETLVASTATDPEAKEKASKVENPKNDPFILPNNGPKAKMSPGGRSIVLFTVNLQSGELKKILYSTDWVNHTQFSPTDPQQLLFCHEGTWDMVNRTWTIRADGTGLKQMHQRTMTYEIEGHEFFSFDGKMVWYDLQTPRSTQFWLAGVEIETGQRIRYPLERRYWSVHYNQSHDGKLFAGDGGGPNSVANRPAKGGQPLEGPGNGQWINLFTPHSDNVAYIMGVGGDVVKVCKMDAERLVDLSKHDYTLEPNVTFTPDNKWIVFRSNMHGGTHVYAVEVKKPK